MSTHFPLFCATSVTGPLSGKVRPLPPSVPEEPPLLEVELPPLLLPLLEPELPPLLVLLDVEPPLLLELELPPASVEPPELEPEPASGTGSATIAQRWFCWLLHVHCSAAAPFAVDAPLMSRHSLSKAAMSS